MSTAVVSTSAALGRHFVFDANFLRTLDGFTAIDPRLAGVTPASRLSVRPAPEMVSSGIAAIDELTGGLPRGSLTEICGPASSGRTALLLAALSAATRRGEFCALVDASDALDPQSAAAASVDLDRLLWVRCGESSPKKSRSSPKSESGKPETKKPETKKEDWRNWENRLEQVLRATDLLLESGGFGLVALDLADLPPQAARRIPLATWFRFRRAVEPTPTALLTLEQQPIAGSCSSLVMKLGSGNEFHPQLLVPSHAQLLKNLEIKAELIRSRLERKSVGSVDVAFASRTSCTDEKTG